MDELCRDKRSFCRDIKYHKGKTSQLRQVFMLRQSFHHQANSRKSYRNITVRIHNQGQHNLCREKDYFYRDRQNVKEVNFLSRQDVEEQHKKNGNKETSYCDIIKSCRQNLCLATAMIQAITKEFHYTLSCSSIDIEDTVRTCLGGCG